MANTRIKDLADSQETFAEDLELALDNDSFDRAKKIKSQIIAPLTKPAHLTEVTSINKNSFYLRGNTGGLERCVLARYVAPDINDFTTSTSIVSNDYIPWSDTTDTFNKKMAFSSFLTALSNLIGWDGYVQSAISKAFILNTIEEVTFQENLTISSVIVADLLYTRIGNIVTLMLVDFKKDYTAGGVGYIDNYVIPSADRPVSFCRSSGYYAESWFSVDKNTGQIYIRIEDVNDARPFLTYQVETT